MIVIGLLSLRDFERIIRGKAEMTIITATRSNNPLLWAVYSSSHLVTPNFTSLWSLWIVLCLGITDLKLDVRDIMDGQFRLRTLWLRSCLVTLNLTSLWIFLCIGVTDVKLDVRDFMDGQFDLKRFGILFIPGEDEGPVHFNCEQQWLSSWL